jgi:Phosphotransferase enzyme family
MTTALHGLYFRNPKELPAPLPTTSEILASNDIIKGIETWATRKVVGVGKHFIAKYSRSNDQIEGENLLFLEQNNLQGFAPRLYAMWKEADGTLFVVMERLRGNTLESLWPTLQESDKDQILAKTREILMQIRSIPHQGFFGSVNKCHMPHHLFYWPDYPKNVSGPFMTERALVQGLISKSRLNAQDNGRHSYLADFFEEQLAGSLVVDGRTPVFTHSDLQRKNILVEEVEEDQNEKVFRVSLVDWESAGWYPVYWEYFAAFLSLKWNDDWCRKMANVVDAWPAEAAMMKMIYQDLWL